MCHVPFYLQIKFNLRPQQQDWRKITVIINPIPCGSWVEGYFPKEFHVMFCSREHSRKGFFPSFHWSPQLFRFLKKGIRIFDWSPSPWFLMFSPYHLCFPPNPSPHTCTIPSGHITSGLSVTHCGDWSPLTEEPAKKNLSYFPVMGEAP